MLFQIWNLNFISVYEMFIVREETIGGVKIRDLSHTSMRVQQIFARISILNLPTIYLLIKRDFFMHDNSK